MNPPVNIPVRYYARMTEALLAAGVDMAGVLHEAGIPPVLLLEEDGLFTMTQVDRLVTTAVMHSGRPELALDAGQTLRITSHSMVGFAMLTSPTVGEALRLLARYFRLLMPAFTMRHSRTDDGVEITFQPFVEMSTVCLVFHLESMVAATHVILNDLLQGQVPKYDLYLSIPRPAYATRYTMMREARCHFQWESAPGFRLLLPADCMRKVPAHADPAAFREAEERCRQLARSVIAKGKLGDWVTLMLREANDGIPTLIELARTLNISPRTLDRHLNAEGIGFRDLFLRVRHERARQLLAAGQLSVTQIAYELGYSETTNFTRAFRKIEGISPAGFREASQLTRHSPLTDPGENHDEIGWKP